MGNNKILEKAREALEEHMQMIVRKGGNMTPPDIEVLTKDLCALEALKRIEQGEGYSQSSGGSYARGRGANGQFVSRDGGSYYGDGSSSRSHDGGSSSRYYDGGSGNSGYSGHSRNDMTIYHIENLIDAAQTEQERQFLNEWLRRVKNN